MGNNRYDPFGKLLSSTTNASPFRFSTKYYDEETGLIDFGYRFYNPETGRWLNRDPIGERGGVNLYGYVGNDPVNSSDYLGLKKFVVGFYGWDDPGSDVDGFANSYVMEIGASVNAVMFPWTQRERAMENLAKALDKNGDRTVDEDELKNNTIKLFGYSYGGATAVQFASKLNKPGVKAGKITFCPKVEFETVFLIDPVTTGRPNSGKLEKNVKSGYSFYQTRGTTVWRKVGSPESTKKFSNFFRGGPIAGASNVNVNTDGFWSRATFFAPGDDSRVAGYFLTGADTGHDAITWILRPTAIQYLK